ncbi:hypothetical protein AJ79_04580, partial [Helicocarpus griseus UAMH5409]
MEGLRGPTPLSTSNEWNEVLSAFKTFQASSQSKYKSTPKRPAGTSLTQTPQKTDVGAQRPLQRGPVTASLAQPYTAASTPAPKAQTPKENQTALPAAAAPKSDTAPPVQGQSPKKAQSGLATPTVQKPGIISPAQRGVETSNTTSAAQPDPSRKEKAILNTPSSSGTGTTGPVHAHPAIVNDSVHGVQSPQKKENALQWLVSPKPLTTHAAQSKTIFANTSTSRTESSKKENTSLKTAVPSGSSITSAAQPNNTVTNTTAVNVPRKDEASQGQSVIRQTGEVTKARHYTSQPAIAIHPPSENNKTPEGQKVLVTPKNPAEKMTRNSSSPPDSLRPPEKRESPSDCSDEVLLRHHRKQTPVKPLVAANGSVFPLSAQPAPFTIENLSQKFFVRSLTIENNSTITSPIKSRGQLSPVVRHDIPPNPTSAKPPKFPRAQENRPAKIRNAWNNGPSSIVKKRSIDEKLERLQREERRKIGQQVRGIDIHAKKGPSFLELARQGEGTDPKSPVVEEISFARAGQAVAALPATPQKNETSAESSYTGSGIIGYLSPSSRSSNGYSVQKKQLVRESDMSMSVVDWQHRPWDSGAGKEFTRRFKKWLHNLSELDPMFIDIASREFNNASMHSDGVGGLEVATVESPVSVLDPTDEANAAHFHETVRGYIYNWNARLQREKEEEMAKGRTAIMEPQMQMQLSLDQRQPEVLEANPHAPRLNLYLRPVEKKDVPGLTQLFNWYIQNTVRCVDLNRISQAIMQDRIDECDHEKLPALVAVEQKPRLGHALNGEKEAIFGYILASDFTGPTTTNRYTAELELFVDPKYYSLGVGKCLLDKLLEICDPNYLPNQGYHFDCAAAQADVYRGLKGRPLSRLIFIIHHQADNTVDYEWIKEWLEGKFGFEEQALLKGTGLKKGN